MSTSRRTAILALIPVLTGIASAFAAEGAFRLLGVRTAQTVDGIYIQLPDGGYGHRPDAHTFNNWFPKPFHVYTDSLGMRIPGNRSTACRDGTTIDVLVIGDSQGFGNGVEAEDSIPGRLGGLLAASGRTLANASVGGHFLRNQMQVLESLGRFHAVRCRAVLALLSPRMISEPSGFSTAVVRNGNLYGGEPTAWMLARQWLSAHSTAHNVLRDAFRRLVGAADDPVSTLLRMYQTGAEAQVREAALLAEVARLAGSARSLGAVLVIAYLPLEAEVRIDRLAATSSAPGASGAVLRSMASRVCAKAGVRFVDVSPALDEVRASGRSVSLDGDPHYAETTSERAANLIWTSIDWDRILTERTVADPGGAARQ